MRRAHIFISGKVQGVWFRSSTKRVAEELGLSGWARNLPDGRVEAVFEGDEEKINKAIEWCRIGPPNARVEKVDVIYEKPEGLKGFEIRY
ncbi:MAG: acylphosphatase [Actinobacteria bacterium]|nr:acylphosphatase [Actinomycetota bacterium]